MHVKINSDMSNFEHFYQISLEALEMVSVTLDLVLP